MELKAILEMWEADAPIDTLNIIGGNANIPILHAKYSRIYTLEKLRLKQLKGEYRMLKLRKEEFLLNPNQEDMQQLGWKVPERGKILKPDLERFIEGDSDLVKKELEIGMQEEKVELLKSIMYSINGRSFVYKNIIEEKRFESGG